MPLAVRRFGQAALAPCALVAIWASLSWFGFGDPIYTPAPSAVAVALIKAVSSGELIRHTSASAIRMAGGFAIALLLAVPAGLIVGRSSRLQQCLWPTLETCRQIPPIALVPLAVLWLGIGNPAKIFLVAYTCFWPIFYNATLGAQEVPPILLSAARVMELSRVRTGLTVTLPASLPAIFVGVRVSLALSLIILLVAEMVGASEGLGFFVIYAERNYETAKMLAGIITIGVLGFGLNAVARGLERIVVPYNVEPT